MTQYCLCGKEIYHSTSCYHTCSDCRRQWVSMGNYYIQINYEIQMKEGSILYNWPVVV